MEFSNGCGAKSIAVDFELKKRGGFLQDYANLRFVLKIGRLRNKILNKRYWTLRRLKLSISITFVKVSEWDSLCVLLCTSTPKVFLKETGQCIFGHILQHHSSQLIFTRNLAYFFRHLLYGFINSFFWGPLRRTLKCHKMMLRLTVKDTRTSSTWFV